MEKTLIITKKVCDCCCHGEPASTAATVLFCIWAVVAGGYALWLGTTIWRDNFSK